MYLMLCFLPFIATQDLKLAHVSIGLRSERCDTLVCCIFSPLLRYDSMVSRFLLNFFVAFAQLTLAQCFHPRAVGHLFCDDRNCIELCIAAVEHQWLRGSTALPAGHSVFLLRLCCHLAILLPRAQTALLHETMRRVRSGLPNLLRYYLRLLAVPTHWYASNRYLQKKKVIFITTIFALVRASQPCSTSGTSGSPSTGWSAPSSPRGNPTICDLAPAYVNVVCHLLHFSRLPPTFAPKPFF